MSYRIPNMFHANLTLFDMMQVILKQLRNASILKHHGTVWWPRLPFL